MKAKYIFFLSVSLLLASCDVTNTVFPEEDDYPEQDGYTYDFIKDGSYFLRGNTVRFYYIDDKGNGLIYPDDMTSLPVSYDNDEKLPGKTIIPNGLNYGNMYNGNHNSVYYDQDLRLYYMMTCAYGNASRPTYTFYIGFRNEFDKMEITYKYTDKNVIGGKYHAKIKSWQFNGTHVYSDDDGYDAKVFVKKAHGRTSVSLTYK